MKTKTGAMSTDKEAIENLINKLEKQNKEIPLWLSLINERSKLQQLSSTFFGSLYDQAKESGGRVRINYRNTQVSTGRLSSGKDINEI
jgi:DNA polymerase I-like protein with 3'-5' exonuclease and polymerase domains